MGSERELKPCPFCGTAAGVHESRHDTDYVLIGCGNEECIVQPDVDLPTRAEAVAAWNTRAATSEEVERLCREAEKAPKSNRVQGPSVPVAALRAALAASEQAGAGAGEVGTICNHCDLKIEADEIHGRRGCYSLIARPAAPGGCARCGGGRRPSPSDAARRGRGVQRGACASLPRLRRHRTEAGDVKRTALVVAATVVGAMVSATAMTGVIQYVAWLADLTAEKGLIACFAGMAAYAGGAAAGALTFDATRRPA